MQQLCKFGYFLDKNIGFSYSDGRIIFDKLDLSFNKGQINYILGKNGIGKSTLIKLLTGVYEAKDGKICLPFKESSLTKIRNRISVMSQDSFLFADSIRNNILDNMK